MKVPRLESTAPFQGFPELVAFEEGLFEKVGLRLEWVDRDAGPGGSTPRDDSPKGANLFASHGSLLEQSKADMYNACEWGNFRRVQDTSNGSSQIGRACFNRAVREAVRRIKADKSSYMRYFIDYYKGKDPMISALSVNDLRESRIVVTDPAPIPADELKRTYEWLKSWGMLETTESEVSLLNPDVRERAHVAAE